MDIAGSQTVLRAGVPLFGGPPEPFCPFGRIGADPFAGRVALSQVILGKRVALFGGLEIPLNDRFHVFGNAAPVRVAITQVALREHVPLFRRQGIPLNGFPRVRDHAVSLGAAVSHIILRQRVFLLGGPPKPRCRLALIGFGSDPVHITEPQIALSFRVTLFGGAAIPLKGFGLIFADAAAGVIEERYVIL